MQHNYNCRRNFIPRQTNCCLFHGCCCHYCCCCCCSCCYCSCHDAIRHKCTHAGNEIETFQKWLLCVLWFIHVCCISFFSIFALSLSCCNDVCTWTKIHTIQLVVILHRLNNEPIWFLINYIIRKKNYDCTGRRCCTIKEKSITILLNIWWNELIFFADTKWKATMQWQCQFFGIKIVAANTVWDIVSFIE